MLTELAEGDVLAGRVEAGSVPTEDVEVSTTLDYVNVRLGTELTYADIEDVFAKLGFGLSEMLINLQFQYHVVVGILLSS